MSLLSDNAIPLYSSLLDKEPELFELIKRYVNKYPEMINELKNTFEKKHWDAFDQCLHDIKSTGGNYGYMCITELAVTIKIHFDSNDYIAITPLLNELGQLHQRMLLAINKQ